jgi:trimeric autotransporter adhesin
MARSSASSGVQSTALRRITLRSVIARPVAPRSTGIVWIAALCRSRPIEEAMVAKPSGWTRRILAVSAPSSSLAPVTIASSTSFSGARVEIERWMRDSRSSRTWRSWRLASRRTFSATCRSRSVRCARSASSSRTIRNVSDSTLAMPRSRSASSPLKPSPERATSRCPGWTGPMPERSSRRTATARQVPTPGTSTSSHVPAAMSTRVRSGTWASGKPIDVTTWPARTTAPTSASSASAARSTASVVADASSANDDTTARNSASCWVDQLPACADIYPTASTTSVWLWNPAMPRVRAISP